MEIEETNLSEDIQDEIQSLVAIFEDEISLDIKPDKIILKMAILPCESEVKLIDQEQRVYFELEVLKTEEKTKVFMKKCKGTITTLSHKLLSSTFSAIVYLSKIFRTI